MPTLATERIAWMGWELIFYCANYHGRLTKACGRATCSWDSRVPRQNGHGRLDV